MINDYQYVKSIPSIDLHGQTRDIARSNLIEFINDNIKLKNRFIRIIHGIGEGILKESIRQELKDNPLVLEYRLEIANPGSTIAMLK